MNAIPSRYNYLVTAGGANYAFSAATGNLAVVEDEDRARAVHFSAPLVAEFDEENLAEIFVAVNGLNNRFRFVKWVIDADMCTISCERMSSYLVVRGRRVCANLLRSFGLRRKV